MVQRRAIAKAITLLESTRADHRAQADELLTALLPHAGKSFRLGISGDAAMAVMQFWQEVAADSGASIRDFTDPTWNTRFLGDLYQDLSEPLA